MTIEDENIDQMVKLIRYEPLENFFTRHPSLDDYKELLRSSESENLNNEQREPDSKRDSDEFKDANGSEGKEVENTEDEEDDVFHSGSDSKEISVRKLTKMFRRIHSKVAYLVQFLQVLFK